MVLKKDALYSIAESVINMSFNITDVTADCAPVMVRDMLITGLEVYPKVCFQFHIGILCLAFLLLSGSFYRRKTDGGIIWIVLGLVLIIIYQECFKEC